MKAKSGVPETKFYDTRASVFLDLIRGLAALVVVVEHTRYLLFVDYPQLAVHNVLITAIYLIASCGHQAVVVFFVLSGYLIGGSVLRMLASNKWSWKIYLTHRLVRLWIVLIPGLALSYAIDSVGIHLGHAPQLYLGRTGTHVLSDVTIRRSAPIAFGNLFFLQTILVPTFGSDGALWSLANEFWYYILFPLGLLVVYPRRSALLRCACGLAFVAVAYFCGVSILESFPIWLLGVGLLLMNVRPLPARTRRLASVLYAVLFLLSGRYSRNLGLGMDYLLGAGTVIFFCAVLSAREMVHRTIGERLSRRLSRFSFTLYVVHLPLCVLLTGFVAGNVRWQPTNAHLLVGAIIYLTSLACAYGVAALTEFRTDSVRRSVETLLAGPYFTSGTT